LNFYPKPIWTTNERKGFSVITDQALALLV